MMKGLMFLLVLGVGLSAALSIPEEERDLELALQQRLVEEVDESEMTLDQKEAEEVDAKTEAELEMDIVEEAARGIIREMEEELKIDLQQSKARIEKYRNYTQPINIASKYSTLSFLVSQP